MRSSYQTLSSKQLKQALKRVDPKIKQPISNVNYYKTIQLDDYVYFVYNVSINKHPQQLYVWIDDCVIKGKLREL